MSGFSAGWLGLREPADHASRSATLSAELAQSLVARLAPVSQRAPLRVLDLATGTGSNPRYLSKHLPAWQEWTLVDADAALLLALPTHMAAWASRAGWACSHSADGMLATGASVHVRLRARATDISRLPLASIVERPALVTASALLDLVSESWLANLVAACAEAQAAVLFALTYDGRMTISPSLADDGFVLELVNAHQATDKGFGPALGPRGAERAATLFAQAGYETRRERSDWILDPGQKALQRELIQGWADAACEMRPEEDARIRQWQSDRLEGVANGLLLIVVGHEDLAAWPKPEAES